MKAVQSQSKIRKAIEALKAAGAIVDSDDLDTFAEWALRDYTEKPNKSDYQYGSEYSAALLKTLHEIFD